ncbi:NAD(P)-dependent dehydrogenase (short-subunit alcohol dehydrogenase family) [Nonomuraea thailandensis]|uniref:NAD(P)-dependent dehydrogenase (Short-subunit alcohol dehydrogenase family) n=1 Tax=Nonomuraea thailandensis TaxID=1188745 RepID=A0A9X2GPX5_9ACTN|nr:SDR family NAD(P)-dependent oxidoreductase [Nonomuraea thailandensis]MCP2358333.1 NAD(P)-dependent dehydrogenase (short-subunit alcohol dehydrogenase family) [Nonomuraea thailandensis]
MTNETQGRVWLITGCSTGFGREIALAALAAGDRVMATARRPETLADLAEIGGGRVSTAALDVTDPTSVQAAVTATLTVFGGIDVLVNNAGFTMIGAVEETSMEQLRSLMEVNFFGAAEVTKAIVPLMREQGSGTIVQMSSLGGRMTYPGLAGYDAAKHALEAFSEALSSELAPMGVRVLLVEPGMFRTRITNNMVLAPENPAYQASSGGLRRMVEAIAGHEPGDPVKGAAAVIQVLDAENPPLRLVLGGDAVDALRAHHEALLADMVTWETLSRSTTMS